MQLPAGATGSGTTTGTAALAASAGTSTSATAKVRPCTVDDVSFYFGGFNQGISQVSFDLTLLAHDGITCSLSDTPLISLSGPPSQTSPIPVQIGGRGGTLILRPDSPLHATFRYFVPDTQQDTLEVSTLRLSMPDNLPGHLLPRAGRHRRRRPGSVRHVVDDRDRSRAGRAAPLTGFAPPPGPRGARLRSEGGMPLVSASPTWRGSHIKSMGECRLIAMLSTRTATAAVCLFAFTGLSAAQASAADSPAVPPAVAMPAAGWGNPAPSASARAYVTNVDDGTVSVIDLKTEAVTATIPVGKRPVTVALTPDGGRAYVTNNNSNSVSVIDTKTETVTTTIPVGNSPSGVTVDPRGDRAYVADFADDNVSVIDTKTEAVIATIPVGDGPESVAFTPHGGRAYVTNDLDQTLSVIDTRTGQVTSIPSGGKGAAGLAITPDGRRLYVANAGSDNVSVIDTRTDAVQTVIPGGDLPNGVAVTPNGRRVYVTNLNSFNVSVIDTGTEAVISTIKVGTAPRGVAISPDGGRAYVANDADNDVSVIDTKTDDVISTIPVGAGPSGVAITPGTGSWSTAASVL